MTMKCGISEVAAQDWRQGGAAESPTPEAHGGGWGGLSEGLGDSAVTGPDFLLQAKNRVTPRTRPVDTPDDVC